jgi:hypothetical protein
MKRPQTLTKRIRKPIDDLKEQEIKFEFLLSCIHGLDDLLANALLLLLVPKAIENPYTSVVKSSYERVSFFPCHPTPIASRRDAVTIVTQVRAVNDPATLIRPYGTKRVE